MNTPNDGGPAYPAKSQSSVTGHTKDHPGMTLRQWFAGQALAGWMAQPDSEFHFQWTNKHGEKRLLSYGQTPGNAEAEGWHITRTPNEAMAQTMYAKADAMIAEGNKTRE
jgi:hypothetical protein